jgi:hypothetical protein
MPNTHTAAAADIYSAGRRSTSTTDPRVTKVLDILMSSSLDRGVRLAELIVEELDRCGAEL